MVLTLNTRWGDAETVENAKKWAETYGINHLVAADPGNGKGFWGISSVTFMLMVKLLAPEMVVSVAGLMTFIGPNQIEAVLPD